MIITFYSCTEEIINDSDIQQLAIESSYVTYDNSEDVVHAQLKFIDGSPIEQVENVWMESQFQVSYD